MNDIKIFAFSDEVSPEIDKQIEALLKNNLNGMEIRNVDGVNVSDITVEKAKEVKEKLDKNDLYVWSIGSPIGKIDINDDFDAHVEKFRHTIKIAKILGTKNIRMFSFYMPQNEPYEKYKDKVIAQLKVLCDIAKQEDITLCHENEKGIYGDTPERCLELFKALPDLKGIFDPANYIQCGVDTKKAFELLKDDTYYMHIKDAAADGFVVPSGKGIGNIKEIAENFITLGVRAFTLEPHLTIFDGLSALEREGEKSNIENVFNTPEEAFDVAVESFKNLIKE